MLDPIIIIQLMAAVTFALSIYGLYLNWKQSKVDNKMDVLIEEVKGFHNTIKTRRVK